MNPATTPSSRPWSEMRPDDWEALARTHGTPFYLFDADLVKQRIRSVRDAMRGHALVYYAVKSNPNLGLLRAVRSDADGVDISSAGELEQARLAGFEAERMSFAGPAKTDAELEAAIGAGVGCISVESLREIDACARIAAVLGTRAHIVLRVNPSATHRAFGLKMGGRAVQFGIDEDALPVAAQRVIDHRELLDFRGIHAYVGSQCFEVSAIVDATLDALRIARELDERNGLRCSKINLGGGFGVSSGDDDRELDIAALGDALAPALQAHRKASPRGCELIFELGRYLTSRAGIYVTRVIGVKTSRGKAFAVCDGGLHHHLAAAGTFGAVLRSNFALTNLTRPHASPVHFQIAGPSCNPTDLLGVDALLPAPEAQDLLGVLTSGSYGLTASPLLFLGRRTPVELVRSGGSVVVGRRSHAVTDFN